MNTTGLKELHSNIDFGKVFFKNFVNLSDAEKDMVLGWRNSEKIRECMFTNHVISKEEHFSFIGKLAHDDTYFCWMALLNREPVGVGSLQNVDFIAGSACIGIYSIQVGAGSRIMEKLLELGFERLGMRELICETLDSNLRALNFFSKFGFRTEDRVRYIAQGNIRRKIVIMSLKR